MEVGNKKAYTTRNKKEVVNPEESWNTSLTQRRKENEDIDPSCSSSYFLFGKDMSIVYFLFGRAFNLKV